MLKKWTLFLLFGLAAQANAISNPADLHRVIASKEWSQGVTLCDALPEEEALRAERGRGELPASHYAEMAALCAAIESGAGDDLAADWWWFTATAIDSKAALNLLPDLRSNGLLTQLSPPRKPIPLKRPPKGSPPHVTLPTGEVVDGQPVKLVKQPRPPKGMFRRRRHTEVTINLLIGTDGIPRQPLLVSAQASPLYTFLALSYLRQWRFAPAMVAGEPTACAYQLTVNTDAI
jgi:hypothetical protein